MPKAKILSNSQKHQVRRHNPLSDDLRATGPLRTKPKRQESHEKDESGDDYIDSRASKKILEIGAGLAVEELENCQLEAPNPAFAFESRIREGSRSDDEDGKAYGYDDDDDDAMWADEDEVVEQLVGHSSTVKRNATAC